MTLPSKTSSRSAVRILDLAAAGALLSTARDLARFITAIMPGSHARIAPAAQLLLTIRRPAPWIGGEQALGWEVRNAAGGAGVVVLSNTFPNLAFSNLSSGGVGTADIAHHLLRPQIPMDGLAGTRY